MSAPWIAALLALWLLLTVVAVGLLGLVRVVTAAKPPGAGTPSSAAPLAGPLPGPLPGPLAGPHRRERPGDFAATGLDGAPVTAPALRNGRHAVLFTHAQCPPCDRILDEIAAGAPGALDGRLTVVVDEDTAVTPRHRRSGATFVVDGDGSMARAFGVHAAPVLVRVEDGVVTHAAVPAGLSDALAFDSEQPPGPTGGEHVGSQRTGPARRAATTPGTVARRR